MIRLSFSLTCAILCSGIASVTIDRGADQRAENYWSLHICSDNSTVGPILAAALKTFGATRFQLGRRSFNVGDPRG